jgi:signal transduction histidine kinase
MVTRGSREYLRPGMTVRRLISRYGDFLLAAALAAAFCLEIATESKFAGDRAISYAAALVLCAALAVRRRAPLVALGVAAVVIELSNLAAPALGDAATFTVAILIAIYSVGRYAPRRALIVGIAFVAIAIPFAAIEPGDPVTPSDFAFFVIFFGCPLLVGRFVRSRREREHVLVDRAAQLAAERDTRAREAVAQERTRIARELHDVVAHAISVMVLQARDRGVRRPRSRSRAAAAGRRADAARGRGAAAHGARPVQR